MKYNETSRKGQEVLNLSFDQASQYLSLSDLARQLLVCLLFVAEISDGVDFTTTDLVSLFDERGLTKPNRVRLSKALDQLAETPFICLEQGETKRLKRISIVSSISDTNGITSRQTDTNRIKKPATDTNGITQTDTNRIGSEQSDTNGISSSEPVTIDKVNGKDQSDTIRNGLDSTLIKLNKDINTSNSEGGVTGGNDQEQGGPQQGSLPGFEDDLSSLTPPQKKIKAQLEKDVQECFDYWRHVMGFKLYRLIPIRRKLLTERLKNYPVAAVKKSISGYSVNPWHLGRHEGNKNPYLDLKLICRDDEKLENGLRYADKHGARPGESIVERDARLRLEAEERKAFKARREAELKASIEKQRQEVENRVKLTRQLTEIDEWNEDDFSDEDEAGFVPDNPEQFSSKQVGVSLCLES